MATKILGVSEEQLRIEAGKPLFEERKYKDGWQMILTQMNDTFLNVKIYDEFGVVRDIKTFNSNSDQEISILEKYIQWFEESPDKNIRKMVKMIVREG